MMKMLNNYTKYIKDIYKDIVFWCKVFFRGRSFWYRVFKRLKRNGFDVRWLRLFKTVNDNRNNAEWFIYLIIILFLSAVTYSLYRYTSSNSVR